MSLLSDSQILKLCKPSEDSSVKPMVIPEPTMLTDKKGIASDGKVFPIMGWGIDSYGYDARLHEDLEIFTNINHGEVFDPKRPNDPSRVKATVYTDEDGSKYAILPPNSFMLGHTVELFNIPKKISAIVMGKSSYARAGIIINPTVLKAGWGGQVVLEISNSTPVPVRIYVNEGICHFMFFKGDEPCTLDYVERGGKYDGQRGITVGKA